MFRRKFIDRLRDKYQFGGSRSGLRNPMLTLGGRTINTDSGTRYGAGAKLSAPFLESVRHGSDASGLRFETDFVGTNSGPISISDGSRGKAYNASLGLRGYHNRYVNRDNSLSLNSNIGAGIGTGDSTYDNEMNPFVDANLSLLKSGRTRKGTNISGGPTLSYGTEGSPNQGLQLGLKGNYGRLSGNVGYDITNKSPKIGASLNFQEGGWKDVAKWGVKGIKALPRVAGSIGSKALGPLSLMLGANKATAAPVIDNSTGINRFTGEQDFIPFGRNRQTGGMYDQMQQFQTGGISDNTRVAKPITPEVLNLSKKDIHNIQQLAEAKKRNGNVDAATMFSQGRFADAREMLQMKEYRNNPEAFKLENTLSEDELLERYTQSDRTGLISPNYSEREDAYSQRWDRPTEGIQSMSKEEFNDIIGKKQTGGTRLPGGEMEPIPGSDAVEFNGQSHDEGGIMVDNQTEVEDGETMDQVTMAKHGGKRKDYFFSSYLKEGGVSYADMHKEILAEGGDQSKIDWLAQMQEKAAGRPADKIQTAEHGGVKKYQTGGPTGPSPTFEERKRNYNFAKGNYLYDDDDITYTDVPAPSADNPYAASSREDLEEKRKKQRNYVYTTSDETKGYNEYLKDMKSTPSPDPNNPDAGILTFADWSEMQKNVDGTSRDVEMKGRKSYDDIVNQSDTPLLTKLAGAAQLGSAAYSYFHKQPDAEQADYTPGFTSPIIAERGKSSKLDRVNYNVERATNASDMRGINKFIETSGGGPANIINKMMSYSKKQQGDAKINAAETRVNQQIANQEAQMEQQMAVNNMSRAQQASTTNAQLSRAETARMDQINANNAAARQKVKDDEEFMKYQGISQAASGLAGIAGDVLSYRGQERLARALGPNGVYDRDKLMSHFLKTKNPLTGETYTDEEAKEATRAMYNKNNPNENS